jgi:hypothetical protein
MRSMPIRIVLVSLALMSLTLAGCGKPSVTSLRDSFAQQVSANQFVRDFQRNGDELIFTGPGSEGGVAKWRIQIDSAAVEPNDDPKTAAQQPYKGVVKSSWYSDGQKVEPSGRESNLPFELLSNGVSQDCWAFWEPSVRRWSWE